MRLGAAGNERHHDDERTQMHRITKIAALAAIAFFATAAVASAAHTYTPSTGDVSVQDAPSN
jgi:hypothetical protein